MAIHGHDCYDASAAAHVRVSKGRLNAPAADHLLSILEQEKPLVLLLGLPSPLRLVLVKLKPLAPEPATMLLLFPRLPRSLNLIIECP